MKLPLLIPVLRDPSVVAGFDPAQWELLRRQARSAGLHGALPYLLEGASVPEAPRAHLDWLRTLTQHHRDNVRNEVRLIAQALADPDAGPAGAAAADTGMILLKGAAYLMAGLPNSAGRLFSDVDILVPKSALTRVEGALLLHGWATTHHDAYDQRY